MCKSMNLNPLEVDVIKSLSLQYSELSELLGKVEVSSREITGVGCYTNLKYSGRKLNFGDTDLGLQSLVNLPEVASGLGVVLSFADGKPNYLEFYTYGSESWSGEINGYSIDKNT